MLWEKHPKTVDDERTILARLSLKAVVLLFVLLVLAASISTVGLLTFLSFLATGGFLADPLTIGVDSLFAILGGDIGDAFEQVPNSRAVELLLKFLSVLLPSLFLGAVVYKMTRPRRRLTVFRKRVNLDPENQCLEGTFYIATRLDLFDLRISCYARYYKSHLDSGDANPYPLKTVHLSERIIPQPFSLIPTRVLVPTRVANSQSEYDEIVGRISSNGSEEATTLLFLVEEARISKFHVDGESIELTKGDSCRLNIIVSAVVPEAQFHLIETESYDMSKHVLIGAAPQFPSEFRPGGKEYVTTNWEAF